MKSQQLPKLRTLTLLLLRLTHQASSAATRAAAAACTQGDDPETTGNALAALARARQYSAGPSRSKGSSKWAAASKVAVIAASALIARGKAMRGGVKRGNKIYDDRWKEGCRLPDAWAEDPAQDRLSVSVENGRDVGCAVAVHALCTVYEPVRKLLIGSVHNDTWCVSAKTLSLSATVWSATVWTCSIEAVQLYML